MVLHFYGTYDQEQNNGVIIIIFHLLHELYTQCHEFLSPNDFLGFSLFVTLARFGSSNK